MKVIYLYGITGAEQAYRVARWEAIDEIEVNPKTIITDMQVLAFDMKLKNGSIERIFSVNWSPEIFYGYREAFKKNSIEGWNCFKDMLERYGAIIY